MTIDISAFIRATSRQITTGEVDGLPVRVLIAERAYATNPADLWDALTRPDRVERWFMPLSGDLQVGGRFQLEGNAGGEILACEAPDSFRITWEMGGDKSWVKVSLAPTAGGTKLTLEHTACLSDAMWDQFGPGAVGIGWELGLLGLDLHVESKGAFDRSGGMTWVGSDNGKATIRACSEEWRKASIAFGTPEEIATASAGRCSAAYTGEG